MSVICRKTDVHKVIIRDIFINNDRHTLLNCYFTCFFILLNGLKCIYSFNIIHINLCFETGFNYYVFFNNLSGRHNSFAGNCSPVGKNIRGHFVLVCKSYVNPEKRSPYCKSCIRCINYKFFLLLKRFYDFICHGTAVKPHASLATAKYTQCLQYKTASGFKFNIFIIIKNHSYIALSRCYNLISLHEVHSFICLVFYPVINHTDNSGNFRYYYTAITSLGIQFKNNNGHYR